MMEQDSKVNIVEYILVLCIIAAVAGAVLNVTPGNAQTNFTVELHDKGGGPEGPPPKN